MQDSLPRAEEPPWQVTLLVIEGPHAGEAFVFAEHDTFVVGRSPQAHFALPQKDPYFSRMHFLVEVNPPLCRLVDLKSHNGTYVNGRKVAVTELRHGDEIRAGTTLLKVCLQGGSSAQAAACGAEFLLTQAQDPVPSALALHQQEAWIHGRPWRVDHYLQGLPDLPQRHASLLDLVVGEIGLRQRIGEAPQVEEYVRRFPQLDGALQLALQDLTGAPTPAQRGQPPKPEPFPEIPGYQLLEEVGRGGMGAVYRARRLADDVHVALKVILPRVQGHREAIERFLREAKILRRLQHPHIVAFFDQGEAGGRLFFAMEYVPGRNAAAVVRADGPLAVDRAVRLGGQMLQALAYAHERGFVHRDLKPANLLLTGEGEQELTKVADFGLARAYEQTSLSGLTVSGTSAGTPQFMPPEQILNFRAVQPAADQYAAAATLYFLLTGHAHFPPARNMQEFFQRILQGEPVPIRERRPQLPGELASVIHRALAREPEKRFADVSEFSRNLLGCLPL